MLTVKIDKLSMSEKKVFALGIHAQTQLEQKIIDSNFSDEDDRLIDSACKTYKRYKVGEIVYQKNMFDSTRFSEHVVLGFTAPLLVNNPFASKEARAGKFRRIIVASTYKGKLSGPYSQPPDIFVKTPIATSHKCPYCRKETTTLSTGGACHRAKCQLQAMRDNM